jgi:SNF2 family DNA or RNA helicase
MNEILYEKLCVLNNIYNNSIGNKVNHNRVYVQSNVIKTELYNHQKALINAMHVHRDRMTRGFIYNNQAINGKLGIIGDEAGTGKTLSVLGYIASLVNTCPRITSELVDNSNKYFFSHELYEVNDASSANLIVVPHYLFNQWKQEILMHTTMKYVAIETKRVLKGDDIADLIVSSQFVLTTSKCYKNLEEYVQGYGIKWNNIFIDEATSVYISPNVPRLRFQFLWLISNNWMPLLFKFPALVKKDLYSLSGNMTINNELKEWLIEPPATTMYDGVIASSAFLKEYLPYNHNARHFILLRNTKHALNASIVIPGTNISVLKCKPSATIQGLVSYFKSRNLDPIIPENKIKHIFQALSIKIVDVDEYLLSQLIHKHSLIKKKIEEGECMICLEKASNLCITNCCHNIYCGKCLLQNAIINHKCPTCRDPLNSHSLVCIDKLLPEDRLLSRTKLEVCLDILRNNRSGKFILYSTFDNIYYQVYNEINKLGFKVERLENNLFTLLKTIKNFNEGKTQVLCVSNVELLRGITLTGVSHLIFYHELPVYELKQVLIHSAQRIGKKTLLNVVHLNSELSI